MPESVEEQSPVYRPRTPEDTDLYRLLLDNLETFLDERKDEPHPEQGYLRPEVRHALESFLACGRLRFGFARLKCSCCKREMILALSCQRRGICPSCHAKRMSIWSHDLIDRLLPDVPYRQWVLTIPKRLRPFFRFDGSLFKGMSTIFADIITDWMRTVLGRDDVLPVIVAADQTYGTLLDFHPHQHIGISDGAFTPDGEFIPMPRLREKDIKGLTDALQRRVLLWLARRGKINPAIRRLMRMWEHSGFNLDASVRIPAGQRERLRKVFCYAHRHPFSAEGISYNAETGKVVYRAKKRHGTKKRNFEVFDAVEFIGVLSQHIPHMGRHRVRYYKALHPLYRDALPSPGDQPRRAEPEHIAKLGRRSWAKALWKVFEVDVLRCRCGGLMRIISIIEHDPVVPKILDHLGLSTDLPKMKPSRASPASSGPGPPGDEWDPCVDPPSPEEPVWDPATGTVN